MADSSLLEAIHVESPAPPSPPKDPFKLPRLLFIVGTGVISLLVFGFIFYTVSDLPPLNEIENPQSSLSTQVLSVDGVVMDNFYTQENRVNVRLGEVSPYVVDALVATEDARFYYHSGVDYYSIPALIKRNITGTTSGGSTITMQLSRNLFDAVGQARTASRKLKEVVVSAILEKNYTKQEIIEAYLNTVNIFGNAYGIEMASQRLFGKSSRDLEVQEAAVLVAMLKGQGVFDPVRKPDTVIARRNLVIDLMVRHGFLDAATTDIDSVKALPLVVQVQGMEHEKGMAPYFRQQVREFMVEWCKTHQRPDGKPYNFYTDGLKVYTTLDTRMQRHAEAAVQEHLRSLQKAFDRHIKGHEPYKTEPGILSDLMAQTRRYQLARKASKSDKEIEAEFAQPVRMALFSWAGPIDTVISPWDSLKYYARFLETGMVSVDPMTGAIKAWVGGIDFRHFKYDHVAQGKRQVGSTFKPFVYAAAMDNGYSPCDVELNQPVVFENVDGFGTTWSPKNSDGQYGGKMTLRSALATSTNLITARLMKHLGPETVARYAYKAGIKTHLDAVPSLCLGTTDLSVLELTGAYATFANQGSHIEPFFIYRIEDRHGNVLQEFHSEEQPAFSPETAYLMVELLKGVVDGRGGTASRLRYRYGLRSEIGAKTGTTQNHSDGWFMGITPPLATGVWVGCADRRMRFRSLELGQGASMALPIWALYMKRLYEDPAIMLPQTRFARPPGMRIETDCDMLGDDDAPPTRDAMSARNRISSDDFDSFD
ncbi:MAG: transglycosylase domain-containing protein [Bacteroidia bacterium]